MTIATRRAARLLVEVETRSTEVRLAHVECTVESLERSMIASRVERREAERGMATVLSQSLESAWDRLSARRISRVQRTPIRLSVILLSEFSLALTVCLAVVALVAATLVDAPADRSALALPVVVLGAGAMFGLGLTNLARSRELAFARALIVTGVFWSLSALMASGSSLPSSVGHVSLWCAVLSMAYLLLSYPSGQVTGRVHRALFGTATLVLAVLFLPTALISQFPHLGLWSVCTVRCARNAFALTHSTPAFVRDVVGPVREVATVALFACVAVGVLERARKAEWPLGQLHAPVVAFAVLQAVIWGAFFPLRAIAPGSGALSILGWIFLLSFPSVAIACATGQPYQRIREANVLERLARDLAGSARAADVRLALAEALEDPSLRVLHSFPPDSNAWVDESGAPVELSETAAGLHVTTVSSGNWRIAVLHDPCAADDLALVLSAGSYALAALENHCLTDELQVALQRLEQSRASRLAAERETRRKIERDLHDGAQQHLIALRLKLGLAAVRLQNHDLEGAAFLQSLQADVDATIDEVRSLARGIYPPSLARGGLADALRDAARSATLPTIVRCEQPFPRYPAGIETAVYFSCSEALQNAIKHAPSASAVTISLWEDEGLHFEVRDDGAGFQCDDASDGVGLSNLRERLAAVGGTLTLESSPGHGTTVRGSIPPARSLAAAPIHGCGERTREPASAR